MLTLPPPQPPSDDDQPSTPSHSSTPALPSQLSLSATAGMVTRGGGTSGPLREMTELEMRALELYRAEEQRANELHAQVVQLEERLDQQGVANQKLLQQLQQLRARYDALVKKLAEAPVVPARVPAPWENGL